MALLGINGNNYIEIINIVISIIFWIITVIVMLKANKFICEKMKV